MNKIVNRTKSMLFVFLAIISCSCSKVEIKPATIELNDNWTIQSSAVAVESGVEISSSAYIPTDWYTTYVPSTVLAALVRNDVYKDVYTGDNFDKIPEESFKMPWWYRTEFNIDNLNRSEYYNLVFEGINYRANIWINGKQVASADTVEQPFQMFDFAVTQYLKKGNNVLAVEVIPAKEDDLTIGWVDWNPWPADNNMGIWRPVKLVKTGGVGISNIFVKPLLNTETLQEATLTISADLINKSNDRVSGTLNCKIGESEISQIYSLEPGEKKEIRFVPEDYPELNINNPRIWWPNNLGKPELYTLDINVFTGEQITDHQSISFGIRDVKDFINENGHKGFMVNGKKLLIKGAGWVDDVLLDDPDEKVEAQLQYVKHMNLNTIRLEGFWGRNQSIYDYADQNGILVMIGWSCQWEWEGYCGRPEDEYLAIRTPEEIELHTRAYIDQVQWLRNHPSVFLWVYGSDKVLKPELEEKLNALIASEDPSRPILNSCGSVASEVSGPSGVKMNGPYAYVTPNYWYEDKERGGAFGFNTETGPGLQPPVIESIRKMIPENHLWPLDNIWDYHTGRNEFATFKNWIVPFNNRYGEAKNVEEFAYKAQMSNYEAIRPMFEAFEVNKYNATGVIQWMLNSSQPGMLWQLYDWYLNPTGAFYGTRKACQPLNIIYNYEDKNIYISNDFNEPKEDLTAQISVFNVNSKLVFSKSLDAGISANSSGLVFKMPAITGLTATYFIDLKLKDSQGKVVAGNFYWLSTKKDVLDFENSEWFVTRNTAYADLKGLNNMEKTRIDVSHEFKVSGEKQEIMVRLENPTDKLAFFIELKINKKGSHEPVLPVFWIDNYISLLPGEKKEITGYVYTKDLEGDMPEFLYTGWNLEN